MTVLYLDTSSSLFCTAIYQDGKVVNQIQKQLEKDMSKEALPLLKQMLEEVSISPNEVDKIIVCSGPGSFTGIRIGMTIAKVYAWALQKDITMISSLEAMVVSSTSSVVMPLIDARRGYVYGALYKEGKAIIPDGYYYLEDLLKKAQSYEPYHVVSNDHFEGLMTASYLPNCQKIIETYQNRESISPHLVNPCYLKQTEAEEKMNG